VLEATDGRGVDLAIDSIGGDLTRRLVSCLADGGSLVALGYVAGKDVQIDLAELVRKRARIVAVSVAREPQERIREALAELGGYFAEGSLTPLVGPVFPLADAADALRCLAQERPLGKVVLSISDGAGG
jgi:NADPH:quinone reductase